MERKQLLQVYEKYNINNKYNIENEILKYIRERIVANQENIKQIIEINKEKIKYEELLEIFDNEAKKDKLYKSNKEATKLENGFITATYNVSIGVIVIEEFETEKVLRAFIEAIKSRNVVIISDEEFSEVSVKAMLLVIFAEALAKFNVNKNLIMLEPYEECDYKVADKVIYEDKTVKEKEFTNKYYIYVEDNYFEKEANEEKERLSTKEVEILTNINIEEAIEKINKEKGYGAVIYTKDKQNAYKFINMINCKNVFVNASLLNAKETKVVDNLYYVEKNIMYQLEEEEKIEEKESQQTEEIKRKEEKEEKNLQVIEENKWYKKIVNKIKKILKL